MMEQEIFLLSDFGKRLRQKRRNRMMTLKQLSEKTKLSVSLLSEIERGFTQPSMSSIKKITQIMGLSLFNFDETLNEGKVNPKQFRIKSNGFEFNRYPESVKVVRADQRKKIVYPNNPDTAYELLTPDLNRMLEVIYMEWKPGFNSGPNPIEDTPCEKFVFILQGAIEFRIGEKVLLLNEGDSVSYPGDLPVFYKILSEETCRAIGVITPPTF